MPGLARADMILSNNLAKVTGGTEQAVGDSWLASSFATDASAYDLAAITLLLQRSSIAGQVRLDLYSDAGLEPGTLLGTLASPASVPSSLGQVTFSATGLSLAANSTYWVVLSAPTGTFDWAWSSDNTGDGVGFRQAWSRSDDAGASWFTTDSFPFQMSVSATAVPEPRSITLVGVGVLALLGISRRRKAPCPA